jgi:thymidylate synthase (FAD)
MINLEVVNPSATLINIEKLIKDKKNKLKCYPACYYVIEHVGRVCYNSYKPEHDDNEMVKFIEGGAERGHRSIFEFGALRFLYQCKDTEMRSLYNFLFDNRTFIDVKFTRPNEATSQVIITGSPRAFIELLEKITVEEHNICNSFYKTLMNELEGNIPAILTNWETYKSLSNYYDLIADVTDCNHSALIDITDDYTDKSKFTKFLFYIQCDRSVSHELVRHRPISVLQASQRYIRYNDKNPYLICMGKGQQKEQIFVDIVKEQSLIAFNKYTELLNMGTKPENARLVLPNVTETKVFLYATLEEYRHIFRMRQSKFAYSPIKEVFDDAYQQLIDKKYI